jgi:CheY-like chemotaxis protein
MIELESISGHSPGGKAPQGHGQRILLVDDEPMAASDAQRNLERLGYQVIACTSAVEALSELSARGADFACVVTDLTMPRMTGLELARMSRRLLPDVPVVLTTAHTNALTVESLRGYGVYELIEKPVTPRALAETLSRLLNHNSNCS